MDDLSVHAREPGDEALGDREQRRARGAFYTPAPLVDFVVTAVLGPLARARPRTLTVLDPACGDGRFLVAAARWLGARAPTIKLRVLGIERDAPSAQLARARLAALPRVESAVTDGEALLGAPKLTAVDAVLGNPPYLRSIRLRTHDPALWRALRDRFAATSHGEWDLYGAFLERSLQWVRPGGRVGLVVPSRWLTAAFARGLRETLASSVEALIDFGAQQLFGDATTYSSVAVLEAGRATQRAAMARLTTTAEWHVGDAALTELGGAPWILRAGPAGRARLGGLTLGDVAQVVKGCGTNADRIFVIQGRARRGVVEGHNGEGTAVTLEAAALRRCWRGRDVEARDRDPLLQSFCVFPYAPAGATSPRWLLRPWSALVAEHPRTARYLAAHREPLERRERRRFAGEQFYQLGRPQNLAFLLDPSPKLVIPDVAARGRAEIDRGSLVLDSAYAVRPREDARAEWRSLPLLHALLRSPMIRLWLEMAGVPLRGDYLRLKTAFLSPLPLPPAGPALQRARAAASAGDAAAASEALRQAYELDRASWVADPVRPPRRPPHRAPASPAAEPSEGGPRDLARRTSPRTRNR